MKVIETNTNGSSHLKAQARPQIGSNEALIKTLGCGICGTDLLKINLKLLQNPTVLGHEICGTVVEVGSQVTGYAKGDKVVCAHHVPCFECHYCQHESYSMCAHFKKTNFVPGGFAQYFKISAEHLEHSTFKLSPEIDWREALFTEPLACCVRNIDRLPLRTDDTVVLVGLGSIGLMMGKLLKRYECNVIGIDLDANRCKTAIDSGFDQAFTSIDDQSFVQSLKKQTLGRGADGIIFTAGPTKILNPSLDLIRNGGFVNLFSHLAGEMANVDTSQLYHRELQVITTYSASPASLKKAFQILKNEKLNLKETLTHYKPQDFEQALQDINQRRVLKAVIEF